MMNMLRVMRLQTTRNFCYKLKQSLSDVFKILENPMVTTISNLSSLTGCKKIFMAFSRSYFSQAKIGSTL